MAEFFGGLSLGLVFLVVYVWWHCNSTIKWYEPAELEFNEDEWEFDD